MPDNDPITAPPDFHHVTLSVSDVFEMQMVRNEKQEITALVSVKMHKENVSKLEKLLREYLETYQDGAGPLVITLEGRFT